MIHITDEGQKRRMIAAQQKQHMLLQDLTEKVLSASSWGKGEAPGPLCVLPAMRTITQLLSIYKLV